MVPDISYFIILENKCRPAKIINTKLPKNKKKKRKKEANQRKLQTSITVQEEALKLMDTVRCSGR